MTFTKQDLNLAELSKKINSPLYQPQTSKNKQSLKRKTRKSVALVNLGAKKPIDHI